MLSLHTLSLPPQWGPSTVLRRTQSRPKSHISNEWTSYVPDLVYDKRWFFLIKLTTLSTNYDWNFANAYSSRCQFDGMRKITNRNYSTCRALIFITHPPILITGINLPFIYRPYDSLMFFRRKSDSWHFLFVASTDLDCVNIQCHCFCALNVAACEWMCLRRQQ